MRLESTKSSIAILASCLLLAVGACGDDGNPGTGGDDSSTGAATDPGTTNPETTDDSVDSTGGGPGTTTDDPTTGLDTTGADDTTTDDTMGSTGSVGDCSTGMSYSMLTSMDNDFITNLDVAGLVSCNMDITITATGGTVCAFDDGAGGYYYTVESLSMTDVPQMSCGLAEVGLTNIVISNIGDGTEVVVDQTGGAMTGNQSVAVLGDVEGMALGMPIGPTPLTGFEGQLPEGDVAFGADDTTFTYADDMTVIATAMPEVVPGIMVTVTLTGLDGTSTFGL